MEEYAVERAIATMTASVAQAGRKGVKYVMLRLEEAENIVSVLCGKTATGWDPVLPVPDEILNSLGWDDMQKCGACGNQLRTMANFCDVCGRAVKKGV